MLFQKFQRTSSQLFTLSFILNQLQLVTGTLIGSLLSVGTLLINLMAYSCWLTASFMIPEHPKKAKGWYGFVQFKHQNKGAAIAGVFSVLFFTGALFFPALMVPGCWCIAVSNLFWLSSEYHRYHNPPSWDMDFNKKRQHIYLKYVGFMCATGVSTALLMTVSLIFPASSVFILTFIGVLSFFFATNATQYWLAQYNVTPPTEIEQFIHAKINYVSQALRQLGFNRQQQKTNDAIISNKQNKASTIQAMPQHESPGERGLGMSSIEIPRRFQPKEQNHLWQSLWQDLP